MCWILSRRVHRDLPLCSKSSAKVGGMQKQCDPLRLIVPSVFDPETTAVLSVPMCQLLPTYQDELLNEPLKDSSSQKEYFVLVYPSFMLLQPCMILLFYILNETQLEIFGRMPALLLFRQGWWFIVTKSSMKVCWASIRSHMIALKSIINSLLN